MIRIARAEAKRLALAVKDLTCRLAENHTALGHLTEELAPGLQSVPGVGPVTSNREIRRNLKRYVCRSIFRQLQTIMA